MIPASSDDLTDVDIMKLIASISNGKQKEDDIDPDVYRVFFSAIFDAWYHHPYLPPQHTYHL